MGLSCGRKLLLIIIACGEYGETGDNGEIGSIGYDGLLLIGEPIDEFGIMAVGAVGEQWDIIDDLCEYKSKLKFEKPLKRG